MEFSLKGLSWAEGICQKLEQICTDNAIIQNPNKYIDALGEQLRQAVDDVTSDWFISSDEQAVAHGFGVPLQEKTITDFENMNAGIDTKSIRTVEHTNAAVDTSSADRKSSSLVIDPIVLNVQSSTNSEASEINACSYNDLFNKSKFSSPEIIQKLPLEEISSNLSRLEDTVMDGLQASSHLPKDSEARVVSFKLDCSSMTGTDDWKGQIAFEEYETVDCMQKVGTEASEKFVRVRENVVAEKSVSFHEEKLPQSCGHMGSIPVTNTEFEDVKLDDGWTDAIDYELHLISSCHCKKSCKEKIRQAFVSKICSRNNTSQIERLYVDVGRPDMAGGTIHLCSDCSSSPFQDSVESDWVLL